MKFTNIKKYRAKIKKAPEKVSFFDGFELVLSYLDIYRNNVIFILVAERCVEVLVCMCFKVLKTLKIGCTEKPHLLKL
ncbi:hypothetical protein EGK15_15795 [Enterococcus faecium]|nr:hypothetical protein [Enterococcus faecium]MCZ1426216.1 hypothetical protein [Enterococcus faecium]MCZ1431957.1 hypothetical protein [Enterococcus faecium]MCZ1440438.1 hypothetical protein [Enterococcus faecium]MCZ1448781.1 hypothetical protein [Enterococcus faecium]